MKSHTAATWNAEPIAYERAFNVYLNGKKINTVFYSGLAAVSINRDEVWDSLVNHHGYNRRISVRENHQDLQICRVRDKAAIAKAEGAR